MSSYLHRLAASAGRTTSPIRPLVGSLYSTPKSMGEPPAETIHEEAAPAPFRHAQEKSHTISAVAGREAQPLLSNLPQENSVIHESPETGKSGSVADAGTHSHFTPLLSDLSLTKTQNHLDSGESRERHTEPSFDQATAHYDSAPAESSNSPIKTFELLRERILQPLITPDVRFNPPPQARPILPAADERAAAQSDQIEIHIGRIEVTAVPAPTAPATVPPARRKSLDLSEYLKRGDGRAS